MKFIVIPILVLLLMSQTFSHWFMVLSFKLNQSYIAKNLCENRSRPKLNCKGNCVLMKKIKQQEKEEQNSPVTLKLETSTVVISSRSFFTISLGNFSNDIPCTYFIGPGGKEIKMPRSFFHPPQAWLS
jgi:hypothetical protein